MDTFERRVKHKETLMQVSGVYSRVVDYIRETFFWLVWDVPTDVDDFVILDHVANRHWHIIISRDNLLGVSILRGIIDQRHTSWKSSLNRFLSNSAYFSKMTRRKLSSTVTEYDQPCA